MEYRCRLGTQAGEIVEQLIAADDEAGLRRDLEQKGFCVIALKPKRVLGSFSLPTARRKRIPSRDFLVFNQELATLLKAGMPLVQSLDILRSRVLHPTFRGVLDAVFERVRAGSALSEAMAEHGALFPGAYTASVLAGEKSGSLEAVLRRYVSYIKVVGVVKRRTISALVYPAVLIALALLVVGIIVLRVVPEFSSFYESFGAELPLATRVIMRGSSLLRDHFVVIGAVLTAAVLGVWNWARRDGQRARFDRAVLRLPWIGTTVQRFATSQLSRTLATLLGGGIPLVAAIDIAAHAGSNQYLSAQMRVVGDRVREGESFASALAARGTFPDVAIKMAEVGEATGALQDMLTSLADFYDEEIETELARFVALIEPALLVIMGVIIASMLLALYMPLFQLSSVVGAK
ncbi:MAG: type II secretion system F family protein [Acidobacteriota bacterium]